MPLASLFRDFFREFVSTPSFICLERNIGVSIRLSSCQSRGAKTAPPGKCSSIVSVARLSRDSSCSLPVARLRLHARWPTAAAVVERTWLAVCRSGGTPGPQQWLSHTSAPGVPRSDRDASTRCTVRGPRAWDCVAMPRSLAPSPVQAPPTHAQITPPASPCAYSRKPHACNVSGISTQRWPTSPCPGCGSRGPLVCWFARACPPRAATPCAAGPSSCFRHRLDAGVVGHAVSCDAACRRRPGCTVARLVDASHHHPSHPAGVLVGVTALPSHLVAQTSPAPAADFCQMLLPCTPRSLRRPPRRLPALRHFAGEGRPSRACCARVQRSWGGGRSERACQGLECGPRSPRRPPHRSHGQWPAVVGWCPAGSRHNACLPPCCCRLLALEIRGCWSAEVATFVRLLAKCRARSALPPSRAAAISAYTVRWSALLSFAAARSSAASLMSLPLSGELPPTSSLTPFPSPRSPAVWCERALCAPSLQFFAVRCRPGFGVVHRHRAALDVGKRVRVKRLEDMWPESIICEEFSAI